MVINNFIRLNVRKRAKNLCEYCHSPERSNATPFTIDHLIPQSLGGLDDLNNLALACHRCNQRRYNFTKGIDPETQTEVPLFNPRKNKWSEHFEWSKDGLKIIPKTAIGRATCNRFDFNDEFHDEGFILNSRQLWLNANWHPPIDDPRQK